MWRVGLGNWKVLIIHLEFLGAGTSTRPVDELREGVLECNFFRFLNRLKPSKRGRC